MAALELAKAIALLSIRMKRCATNDAWADARPSLDQASDMVGAGTSHRYCNGALARTF
jgi:hypothetical protein